MAVSPPARAYRDRQRSRADGTEIAYSPERILAYGLQEFEFDRRWAKAVRFIGPLTAPPPFPPRSSPQQGNGEGAIRGHGRLEWVSDRRAVLVTLGTHLWWAKERAIELLEEVARRMPDTEFHLSRGQMGSDGVGAEGTCLYAIPSRMARSSHDTPRQSFTAERGSRMPASSRACQCWCGRTITTSSTTPRESSITAWDDA